MRRFESPGATATFFEAGWPENGIGDRRDDSVDARLGGELIVPVHRHEEAAARLPVGNQGAHQACAVGAFDLDEIGAGDAELHGVARVDFDEGLGDMGGQPGALCRSASSCATGRGCGRC